MAHSQTREEAKHKLPNGWAHLVDLIYDIIEEDDNEVAVIKDRCGWLRTMARTQLSELAAAKLSKVELRSDRTCMHCGHYGKRRSRGLYLVLCEECELAGIEKRYGKTFDPFDDPFFVRKN